MCGPLYLSIGSSVNVDLGLWSLTAAPFAADLGALTILNFTPPTTLPPLPLTISTVLLTLVAFFGSHVNLGGISSASSIDFVSSDSIRSIFGDLCFLSFFFLLFDLWCDFLRLLDLDLGFL